jgi:hypothetical protein
MQEVGQRMEQLPRALSKDLTSGHLSQSLEVILPGSIGHLAKRAIPETEVNHEKRERRSNNVNCPQQIYGIV